MAEIVKPRPSELKAIMKHEMGGRVAILNPFTAKVITVIQSSNSRKCGYIRTPSTLEGRFQWDPESRRFQWTRNIVSKHRGYVEVVGIQEVSQKCPPMKIMEETCSFEIEKRYDEDGRRIDLEYDRF
jgi:hypothetical protein